MAENFTRRKFIRGSGLSVAGLMLAPRTHGPTGGLSTQAAYDIMQEVRKYRKIDSYATSNFSDESLRLQLDFADRFGIEKLFIAMPMTEIKNTPDEFRAMNDTVHKTVNRFSDRLVGQFTFNPIYKKESLEEITRCVDRGMVGSRIYHQVKINDPLFYPFIEKFIALKMMFFMHGEVQLGVGGYRMKYDAGKSPTISGADDFADAAKRYPEAMFQYPHLGGGGDWEYVCKVFKNHANIFVDLGGSDNQENMVDFALRHLGEDRLLFGSDTSFYQAVGKVLSSTLNESQKKKVFFENYNKILRRGGYHVG
jgi:predicted TIM-barrel fold metal-dependent hydrolase